MDIFWTIRYLIPDAKFRVTNNNYKDLDWNPKNTVPCPSMDSLYAVNQEDVEEFKNYTLNSEKIDGMFNLNKDDLSIKQGFLVYKESKPESTFRDYLEYLVNLDTD